MARRRKEIVMPHLNDCGGDISKKWYVEYSIRNPQTGKMERIRHYDGINQYYTAKERCKYAEGIIADYSQKILSGSITYQEFNQYEDFLLYDGQRCFTKKSVAPVRSIRLYISDFLQIKKLEVNEDSLRTYISQLRIFCQYAELKRVIDKPATYYTHDFITEYLHYLVKEKGLSRATILKHKQLLHNLFNFLKRKKIIQENPADDIPAMGVVKDKAPASIPAYMRKLLQQEIEYKDPQLWMFLCFQYYAAIRPGKELRLMLLNQINYNSRTFIIHGELSKNNRTETIDIPDNLYDMIINKWKLHTYNQNYYIFGQNNQPGETCLGKNNMKNRFNAFRDKLKLPKSIKLYSFKHSGAQELADNGASIYEIQRHLRHRDITTTEKYLKKRIGQKSSTIKHNFPEI